MGGFQVSCCRYQNDKSQRRSSSRGKKDENGEGAPARLSSARQDGSVRHFAAGGLSEPPVESTFATAERSPKPNPLLCFLTFLQF